MHLFPWKSAVSPEVDFQQLDQQVHQLWVALHGLAFVLLSWHLQCTAEGNSDTKTYS